MRETNNRKMIVIIALVALLSSLWSPRNGARVETPSDLRSSAAFKVLAFPTPVVLNRQNSTSLHSWMSQAVKHVLGYPFLGNPPRDLTTSGFSGIHFVAGLVVSRLQGHSPADPTRAPPASLLFAP